MTRKKSARGRKASPDVGYSRPPSEHQFKKGQSGNPKGRPRGAKGVSTLVLEAANAPIRVTENGKVQQTTVLNAAVKQQALKAAGGDPRATERLIAHVSKAEEAKTRERPDMELSEADRLVIAEIYERMLACTAATPSPQPADNSAAEPERSQ